jgi:transketolase
MLAVDVQQTTTGPLGQGLANAVGMALAEQLLAAEFNREGHTIVDQRSGVFIGDGCRMEGISQEAISLAGTPGLGKLIALYDDNGISIDGDVAGGFADDAPACFRARGWQVIGPVDGHDLAALDDALATATAASDQPGRRPTLIVCRTTIGKGAAGLEGTAEVHGARLGAAGVAALRERLGWTSPPFEVPDDLCAARDAREAGAARQRAWDQRFAAYRAAHPALAAEFERRMAGGLPADWAVAAGPALVALAEAATKPMATCRASRLAVEAGQPDAWWRYTGRSGAVIGLRRFGESAPGAELMRHFGFTADAVMTAVRQRVPAPPEQAQGGGKTPADPRAEGGRLGSLHGHRARDPLVNRINPFLDPA